MEPKEHERMWLTKKPYKQQTLLWSIYLQILLDALLLRLSLHFTQLQSIPLHYTCRHITSSHLNFTQLHFTKLSFGLTHLNFLPLRSASPHITTLQLTSLQCTFRQFSPHFYSFHFTQFIIAFLSLFLKILGLQEKVANASAVSWFQV